MSFLRNRTVGHCSCLETLHDRVNALDLINRDTAVLIELEINQATQVDGLLFLIECMAVLLEDLVAVRPCGLLKQMDRTRIVEMLLLTGALLVASDTLKRQIRIQTERIKCT